MYSSHILHSHRWSGARTVGCKEILKAMSNARKSTSDCRDAELLK